MSGEAVHSKQSAAIDLERLPRDGRDKSVDSIERLLRRLLTGEPPLARPPNYRQQKKQREQAKANKNEQKRARRGERPAQPNASEKTP
jgi:hypothetical protein